MEVIDRINESIIQQGLAITLVVIFLFVFLYLLKKQNEKIDRIEAWKTDFLTDLIKTEKEEKDMFAKIIQENTEVIKSFKKNKLGVKK